MSKLPIAQGKALSLARPFLTLNALFARLRNDHSGIAATEFALVLPLMIGMYIGTVEVTGGVIAKRRVNSLARTLADLTSQTSVVNAASIQDIFDASQAVMSPLDISTLKMRVSSVMIKTDGTTCVDWSDARNTTKLASGSSVSIPSGLRDPSATSSQGIIMGEVEYLYTPVMTYVIVGPITIKDTPSYMRPRIGTRVTYNGIAQVCP